MEFLSSGTTGSQAHSRRAAGVMLFALAAALIFTMSLPAMAEDELEPIPAARNMFLYFEAGAGINAPTTNRRLPDFGQAIDGASGPLVFGEVGGTWPNVIGNVDVSAGIVVQYQSVSNNRLVNDPPFTGSLPLGGTTSAVSIFPIVKAGGNVFRGSVGEPIFRDMQWRAGAGAGIAFQDLKATNGGVTVLSGSRTTAMVHLQSGLGFALTETTEIWVDGFATWFDGFTVHTNTGVRSDFQSIWTAGVVASVKLKLERPFRDGPNY